MPNCDSKVNEKILEFDLLQLPPGLPITSQNGIIYLYQMTRNYTKCDKIHQLALNIPK
jgi:hypothetical protein